MRLPGSSLFCKVLLLFNGTFTIHLVSGTPNLMENVNTLIGTSYFENQFDVHDYGNTAPFAGPPFAHTPWTAQTRDSEDKCQSPYYYFDSYWHGMRRSHWMSGSCTIDYGSATIIPSVTNNLMEALTYHTMNHSAEISTPASYMIDLQESSLLVEAASDVRSGIMKVTPYATTKHEYFYLIFKASDTMYNESYIKISQPDDDLSSESEGIDNIEYVRLENEKEKIFGNSLAISSPVHRWYQSKQKNANFSGHHYFMTSRPACEYGMIEDYRYIKKNQLIGVSNKKGTVAAYLKFKSSLGEVRIATGTSFVSVEKAKQNLYSELGYGANFAEDLWSEFYLSPDASHLTDFGKKKKSRIVNSADRMGSNDSVFDMNKLINKVTSIWEEKLGAIKAVPFINNNESKKSLDLDKFQRAGGQTISSNSSKNQLITFYSSLWHTQLLPRVISDYDGQYLSFSEKKRILMNTSPKNNFHNYFDDFSMWDIFRAQLPLFTLAYTENIYDMVKSLIKKAEEGDWLPIFPAWNSYTDEMIGDHCGVFISDCYFKNLLSINHYNDKINDNYDDDDNNENNSISTNNYLLKQTYKYLIKNALSIPSDDDYKKGKGRRALESYMTYGFIPLEDEILDSAHTKQQVSRTLEYAYDDYVVSQLAKYYSKSILDEMYGIEVLDPQRNTIKNNEKLQRLLTDLIDSEKNEKILLERSQNYRWVIDGNTDNIWYEKKLDQYHGDKVNLNDNLSVIDVKYEKKGGKINLDKNDGKMNDEKRREGNGKEESVGFVRGRHANLSWTENFDSFDPSKYYTWLTETNVWQYTFSVLHDVEGMIEVYGGIVIGYYYFSTHHHFYFHYFQGFNYYYYYYYYIIIIIIIIIMMIFISIMVNITIIITIIIISTSNIMLMLIMLSFLLMLLLT